MNNTFEDFFSSKRVVTKSHHCDATMALRPNSSVAMKLIHSLDGDLSCMWRVRGDRRSQFSLAQVLHLKVQFHLRQLMKVLARLLHQAASSLVPLRDRSWIRMSHIASFIRNMRRS
jgi:hypothetical protein